jgi:hypothetical protein
MNKWLGVKGLDQTGEFRFEDVDVLCVGLCVGGPYAAPVRTLKGRMEN